eukprot:1136351-Pelagomonas_calceolata.AAC.1
MFYRTSNLARTSQGLDMQIAIQAITLTTRACYLMQIRALAMPSGTCPVSRPKCNTQSSNTAQAPSTIKNMRYASENPLALFAPSKNVIIWITPSTFSQAAQTV